jgi:hypothetical protein
MAQGGTMRLAQHDLVMECSAEQSFRIPSTLSMLLACLPRQGLVVGDQVLLIAWGNITITAITTQPADSSCGDSTMCGQRAGDSTISRPSAAAQRTLQQQQPQQVRSSATAQQQIQQEGKEETGSGAADGMESLDVVPPRDQRQPSTSGSVEAQLAAAEASMRCLGMSNGDTETQTPPLQAAAAAAAGAGSGSGELVGCQRVIEMEALLCLEASPKGVQRKVHWVPALPPGQLVPLRLVSYDLPCTSERLTAEDDAVACFDWGSRWVTRRPGAAGWLGTGASCCVCRQG